MALDFLELALLAGEQFVFLLEPQINGALDWLNYKKISYCEQRPWLIVGEKMVANNLDGFGEEISKYVAMNLRALKCTNQARAALMELARQRLALQWPWASITKLAPLNELDILLNWRMNYDLCIIDDWDFPGLAPALNDNNSDDINDLHCECHSSGISQISRRERASMEEPRGHRRLIGEEPPVLPKACPRSPNCRTGDKGMKIIKSFASERLLLVQFNLERKPAQPGTACDEPRGATAALSLKMISSADWRLEEARSSQVFYYSQIQPDLASLYLVVVRLLELAGLVEPSSDRLAARLACSPPEAPAGQRAGGAGAAASSESRPLLGALFREAGHEAECGEPSAAGAESLLSRYALVLMLVAYLHSERAQDLRRRVGGKQLPARLLIDFLGFHARLQTLVIGPAPAPAGKTGELAVLRASSERPEAGDRPLAVLDPVQLAAMCPPAAAGQLQLESLLASRANLTRSLSRPERLFGLLQRLTNYLDTSEEGSPGARAGASRLELMFQASSGRRAPDAEPARLAHTPSLLRFPVGGRAAPLERAARRGRTYVKSLREEAPGPGGRRQPPKRLQINLHRSASAGRRLLTNLLYLSVFILLRNQLMGYLEQLRLNWSEQTREELVQLKQTIFARSHGLHGWAGRANDAPERRQAWPGAEALVLAQAGAGPSALTGAAESYLAAGRGAPGGQVTSSGERADESREAAAGQLTGSSVAPLTADGSRRQDDAAAAAAAAASNPRNDAHNHRQLHIEAAAGELAAPDDGMEMNELLNEVLQTLMKEAMAADGSLDLQSLMGGLGGGGGGGDHANMENMAGLFGARDSQESEASDEGEDEDDEELEEPGEAEDESEAAAIQQDGAAEPAAGDEEQPRKEQRKARPDTGIDAAQVRQLLKSMLADLNKEPVGRESSPEEAETRPAAGETDDRAPPTASDHATMGSQENAGHKEPGEARDEL